jgi:hypothetical protein
MRELAQSTWQIATQTVPQPTKGHLVWNTILANVPYLFYIGAMQKRQQTLPPNLRRPARAAQSNDVGRFDPYVRNVERDGWDIEEEEVFARTEVSLERPRKILTRNSSPDISFDRSINPYRGCEHGCIRKPPKYCAAN